MLSQNGTLKNAIVESFDKLGNWDLTNWDYGNSCIDTKSSF